MGVGVGLGVGEGEGVGVECLLLPENVSARVVLCD